MKTKKSVTSNSMNVTAVTGGVDSVVVTILAKALLSLLSWHFRHLIGGEPHLDLKGILTSLKVRTKDIDRILRLIHDETWLLAISASNHTSYLAVHMAHRVIGPKHCIGDVDDKAIFGFPHVERVAFRDPLEASVGLCVDTQLGAETRRLILCALRNHPEWLQLRKYEDRLVRRINEGVTHERARGLQTALRITVEYIHEALLEANFIFNLTEGQQEPPLPPGHGAHEEDPAA
jgi:hypothetical protein